MHCLHCSAAQFWEIIVRCWNENGEKSGRHSCQDCSGDCQSVVDGGRRGSYRQEWQVHRPSHADSRWIFETYYYFLFKNGMQHIGSASSVSLSYLEGLWAPRFAQARPADSPRFILSIAALISNPEISRLGFSSNLVFIPCWFFHTGIILTNHFCPK